MGLNNVKANDYVNVVIQALVHIPPLRDYFILQDFEKQEKSQLGKSSMPDLSRIDIHCIQKVTRFGALVRKMWNPRAFKGQVSPHELLQASIEVMDGKERWDDY